jgi:hypothetical protein
MSLMQCAVVEPPEWGGILIVLGVCGCCLLMASSVYRSVRALRGRLLALETSKAEHSQRLQALDRYALVSGSMWLKPTPALIKSAVAARRLDLVKRLRALKVECPWDGTAMGAAALLGDIAIMEWLRNPDTGGGVCPWDAKTVMWAVAAPDWKGTLEWLRNSKTGGGVCPWGPTAVWSAVGNQNYEALAWLRDPTTGGGPCEWDKTAYEVGTPEIRAWLHDPATGGGMCPHF